MEEKRKMKEKFRKLGKLDIKVGQSKYKRTTNEAKLFKKTIWGFFFCFLFQLKTTNYN